MPGSIDNLLQLLLAPQCAGGLGELCASLPPHLPQPQFSQDTGQPCRDPCVPSWLPRVTSPSPVSPGAGGFGDSRQVAAPAAGPRGAAELLGLGSEGSSPGPEGWGGWGGGCGQRGGGWG